MPTIRYVDHTGASHDVEVPTGTSLMEGAINGGVDGIDAECGGCMACATCHVYVDPAFMEKVGAPGPDEADMLTAAAAEVRENSRLSCQIVITPELAGLVVRIPETQT